ncbi:disease resistance protein RPP13-like isoform X3 [Panicum hallii]|uniref:disease resistance protein RPP13-like isoform X3 n=1 Tax=Panicum hallii TaxID=206008 RepID=UPI000DF4DFB4|nr:disease resistance protein RPP13-like isoform X3 [Panicum hallii]
MAEQLYHTLNDPCRYAVQSWTSESHGGEELHEDRAATPRLVGIDGRMKKLRRCLLYAGTSLRILSIFGPGGIGKTALAMEFQRQFQQFPTLFMRGRRTLSFQPDQTPKLWHMYHISAAVSLSKIRSFLCYIYQQITGRTIQEMETADTKLLILLIRENLQHKRYFILIDDLRDASVWGIIKHVFPDNNWGCRIVITTRLRSVARSCCSDLNGIVYKLKPLNESDSTQLLMTTAFGPVKDVCLPEGSRDLILRSCNGVPLLITAFADNIKEQLQTAAPNSYGQSPGFSGRTAELHSVEEGPQLPDQVRCALTRICRDLPVELMTLLQYMRMFPRGYMFEKDYLVMKWMAKGLTHSEEEAECHFSELVDRNIFTLVLPTGEHNLDEAEPCRWQVNNLKLQFISSTTRRPAFVFTGDMLTSLEPPTIRPSSELCMPRLVALHSPEPDIQGLMHTIDWGENVRSLAVSGIVDQVPLNKFNYLVMLDLEDWKNLKDEDLLQICNSKMYLLRYLSVSNMTECTCHE